MWRDVATDHRLVGVLLVVIGVVTIIAVIHEFRLVWRIQRLVEDAQAHRDLHTQERRQRVASLQERTSR